MPKKLVLLDMLHTVVLFRTLGVVETVERTHKVAGDATDTLKFHALPNHNHGFAGGGNFLTIPEQF